MFNVKLLYMKAFDKWCSRDVYFCEKITKERFNSEIEL